MYNMDRQLNPSLHTLCAALALCAALLSSPLAAADEAAHDAALSSRVTSLLSGLEYVPSAQEWQALGPDAAPILRAVAADPSQLASTRARAISALSHFDDPETRPFLEAVLANASHPEVLRRNAVTVLSLKHGVSALPTIEPLLAVDSYNLRETAVRAVARLSVESPKAKAALSARLSVEPSAPLRSLIEQSLAIAP
jgi:HEAT repeat protein